MTATPSSESPSSLLGITVRRSMTSGRFYLVYGSAVSIILAVALGSSGGSAFVSAFPLVVPVFGIVGAMGGLMVFSSDRMKGVLEYLLAYGISTRRQFLNVLLASFVLATIVLGVALGAGVGVYLAKGNTFSFLLAEALCLYALPMTYASTAFATAVGASWTALSSPRMGVTGPIGLAPLIGILPPMATVGVIGLFSVYGIVPSSALPLVAEAALVILVVVVLLLFSRLDRLMPRERLLSPM